MTFANPTYARVAGEAFDADPVTLPCSECGRGEWSCLCETEPYRGPQYSAHMVSWAEHKIAKAFGLIDVAATIDADGRARWAA